jgi:hypothetical protein
MVLAAAAQSGVQARRACRWRKRDLMSLFQNTRHAASISHPAAKLEASFFYLVMSTLFDENQALHLAQSM